MAAAIVTMINSRVPVESVAANSAHTQRTVGPTPAISDSGTRNTKTMASAAAKGTHAAAARIRCDNLSAPCVRASMARSSAMTAWASVVAVAEIPETDAGLASAGCVDVKRVDKPFTALDSSASCSLWVAL